MSGIIYYLGDSPEVYSQEIRKTAVAVALELAVIKLGSKTAVADALGITRGVLYNWLGRNLGGRQTPTQTNLDKLARLINVPVEILESD